MKKTFVASVAAAALALTTFSATAQMPAGAGMKDPMVGGAAMFPSKTIVDNAVNSPIHTTWSPPSRLPAWSTRSTHLALSPSSRPPTTPLPSSPPAQSTLW